MPREDTRERLLAAAKEVIHRQGYAQTTLADIATAANIPLGNVYYHFHTKDSIAEAVIQAHLCDQQAVFAAWGCDPDPRSRLKSLVRSGLAATDLLTRYGCPSGSLCQELEKRDDQLAEMAARLLHGYLAWAEQQFRMLGKSDEAHALAVDLVAAWQGTLLLANSFRSPELLQRKVRRLEAWLDSV